MNTAIPAAWLKWPKRWGSEFHPFLTHDRGAKRDIFEEKIIDNTLRMNKKNIKKTKNKKTRELVSKISNGVLNSLIDFALFGVYYCAEMGSMEGGSLYQKFRRIDRDFEKFDSQSLRSALGRIKSKGWLDDNLKLTDKGQKRLDAVLPEHEKKAKWEEKWYIVAYDIPEHKRLYRDILRNALKNLGFGRLHKSLWISPFNFLGDVEDLAKKYKISRFVLLAVSNRLGREDSAFLAERIWKLDEVNEAYEEYIEKAKEGKLSPQEKIFSYLIILKNDPQLPKELLPENWFGEEANKIYKKVSRREKTK